MSEQHFVKIRLPDKKEARIINVSGFSDDGFNELREKTKDKFNLVDDDFYYLYKDPTDDMVSIRNADDYRVLYNFCTATLGKNRIGFQFTLVLPNQQNEPTQQQPPVQQTSLEDGFINIFQAVINNIESGISNFQHTVEMSTTTAADKLSQAATEAANNVYRATQPNEDSSSNPNFRYGKTDKSKEKEPLQKAKHIAAICDYCNSLIEGTRHKCTVCPDFDFCHTCYVIAKDSHYDHKFKTIVANDDRKSSKKGKRSSRETRKSKSYPVHFGVHCDNCQVMIKGIRYKCGHCPDFDLCEACERLPCHEESHVFLKIKSPIQSLPMKPLLPRFIDFQMKPGMDAQTPIIIKSDCRQRCTDKKNGSEVPLLNTEEQVIPEHIVPKETDYAPVEPKPTLSASFIVDVNIPDGTTVTPNTTFIKMWKLKNTGSQPWPAGSQLVYHSGDILRSYPCTHPYGFAVPSIGPNEEACVVAELEAPENPGEYTSYFSVTSPEGTRFGDVLWCTIKVEAAVMEEEQEVLIKETPGECSMIYPVLMHDSSSDIHHQVPNEMTEVQSRQDDETFSLASSDLIQVQVSNPFEDAASTTSSTRSMRTHSSHNSASSSRSGRSQRTGSYSSTDDFIMVDTDKEEEEEDEDEDDKSVSTHLSNTVPNAITFKQLTQEKQPSFTSSPSSRSIGSNTESSTFEDATSQSHHSEAASESSVYKSQLLQIHEMGFNHCDELTVHLLRMYDGAVDKVVPKLLETLYP
ncbi:hypothetical protein K501DRAFT_328870 [Backusella circina FSU 941]|nr:hypothetical protein K501DRAFT_328870 [Backusella circina FSU 941]